MGTPEARARLVTAVSLAAGREKIEWITGVSR